MSKFAGVCLLAVVIAVGACGAKSPAVGTWTIEKESLKALMMSQISQMPAEMQAAAKAQVEEQVKSVVLEFTMNADGTFSASGNMMGNKFDAKGTWKLEGEKLSITTTTEDGKEKTSPETQVATLSDGKIKIKEEGMPFEMVLIKK